MGKKEVAKIEIASVTQNIAIRSDTAAALIASGSIFSGGGNTINRVKAVKPNHNPIFCRSSIAYCLPNKYSHAAGAILKLS